MKKIILALACLSALAGCNQADVASRNLSTAADNFQIERRIVFYNTVSDKYMLTIEGRCSLGNQDPAGELSVTCEVGPGQYKKHFLGLSRNVTYLVEQMDAATVSPYHYKVVFQPGQLVPELEVQ
jgi:hypothetical protein